MNLPGIGASKIGILLIICSSHLSLFSQQIDEGCFNNWDFGPTSVHGNLRLNAPGDRKYFKIKKLTAHTARITEVHPPGYAANTLTITFANGILQSIEEMGKWGEVNGHRFFTQIRANEFRVSDEFRGVNNFLPCKYARYIYENELLKEIQYFSFSDKLTENRNGIAIIRFKRYDDSIRFAMIKEIAYFDKTGKAVLSKATDYHKIQYEVDDRDNRTLESYFGLNGAPTTFRKSNISSIRFSYDGDNNQLMASYLGLDGKVTRNISGIAATEYEYTNGYQVSLTRYDSLHQVTRADATGDGIAIIRSEYDSAGNNIKETFFDESNKPINDHTGVHAIYYRFDSSNMLIRTAYFNLSEKPSWNRDKIHAVMLVRDSVGRIIEQSSFGLFLEPVKDFSDEVQMQKFKYDRYGRQTEISYWRDSNTRMPRWNGIYAQTTTFNEDGQPVAMHYLDQEGRPMKSIDGSSEVRLLYRPDGAIGERQFLFANRPSVKLQGVTAGYSSIKYGYDNNSRISALTFYGRGQEPVDATISFDTAFSAHRIVFIYSGTRVVEESFFSVNSNRIVRTVDCLKSDFITPSGITQGRRNHN